MSDRLTAAEADAIAATAGERYRARKTSLLFMNWRSAGNDTLGVEAAQFATEAEIRAFLLGVRMTLQCCPTDTGMRFVHGRDSAQLRQRLKDNPNADDTADLP
jgi:hypothetical protein